LLSEGNGNILTRGVQHQAGGGPYSTGDLPVEEKGGKDRENIRKRRKEHEKKTENGTKLILIPEANSATYLSSRRKRKVRRVLSRKRVPQ